MPIQRGFYSTLPGLNTSDNILNLPEGSLTKALNVTIIKENIIEPRHGIPPLRVNLASGSTFNDWSVLDIKRPTPVSISMFSGTFPWTLTIPNHGMRLNDILSLSLISGALPTGYTAGNPITVASVVDVNTVTVTVTGLSSITSSDPTSVYELEFNKRSENLLNMFYWRDGSTDRYVAVSRNNVNSFRTYFIRPQDYYNPSDTTTYVTIREAVSSITSSVFKYPRFITSDKGLYVSEAGQWFAIRSQTFPPVAPTTETIKQPLLSIVNLQIVNDTQNAWLLPGYAIRVKAVSSKILVNGSEVEGAPTDFTELRNLTGVAQSVTISVQANAQNTAVSIYRTKQYLIPGKKLVNNVFVNNNSEPEVDYFLAGTLVTNISIGSPFWFGVAQLNFNDDIIIGTGELYTNGGYEGDTGANMDMPLCNDAYNFKGHTFFADVLNKPSAKLSLLSLQATTTPSTIALNGQTLTLGSTTYTFQDRVWGTNLFGPVTVENNPPATLGDVSQAYYGAGFGIFNLTTKQYIAPGGSGTVLPTKRVRILAYDAATNTGDVVPDGNVTAAAKIMTAVINYDITSLDVNFEKFNVPGGGMAYLGNNHTSNTIGTLLFRYNAVERIPGGVKFTNVTEIAGQLITPLSANPHYVYYIPGTAVQNLPLYLGSGKIGVNDTVGNASYSAYYSLIPSKNRYGLPIAAVNTLAVNALISGSLGGEYLSSNVVTQGAMDRSASQLVDDTAENLSRTVNSTQTTYTAIKIPGEVGAVTIRDNNYISVTARVGNINIGAKFDPPLTLSNQILSDTSKTRVKNGVCISKQGIPESVALDSINSPVLAGNSQNRVVKLASLKDTLYFFKENEGVYACSVQAGAGKFPSAVVNEIAPFDLTIKPIAPESIRIADDQIIYLADKGFVRIRNGRNEIISTPIDIEVKISSTRTPDLDKVVAYVDHVKRLYVCHIPWTNVNGRGTTYIYNIATEMWSTSDVEFDWGISDNIGRVTTITTDYRLSGDPVQQDAINGAAIPSNRPKLTQYFRQEQLTGRVIDGVVTSIYDPVITVDGDTVNVLQSAVNILNSSFDQFDERIQGFTTAVLNSPTSVTLTRTRTQYGTDSEYNLKLWIQRLREKQLYYKTTWNNVPFTSVPVTLTQSIVTPTSVNITFALPSTTESVVLDPILDQLLVGVNTDIEFAPYHLGSPQTLKQFSEAQFHYQDRLEPQSLPLILNGQFAVDNQPAFGTNTRITRKSVVSGVYRFMVPVDSIRGRYLRVKIRHDYPENYFALCGVSIVVRNTPSTNTVSKA